MISLRELTKTYGSARAVDGLSLDVAAGEIVGLIGPNGAGKTSTLRCIAGIHRPTGGLVVIAGKDIVREPVEAKRRIAFVADEPHLFEHLTVIEHLRLTGRLYGVAEIEARAAEWLKELELTGRETALPSELSRGMKQKVALACALVHDPQALVLDEPLTGLDPLGIHRMKQAIVACAGRGVAVLVSSHLLHLVEELCTRIVIINHGVKVADGTMAELASQARLAGSTLERIFLDVTGKRQRRVIGIFVYLTVCSIRNSVRLRIRRLRQPRYLLIAVGVVLWLGSMMIGRRTSGGPFGHFAADGPRGQIIAAGFATLMLGATWLLPVAAALRFTSAEVQFLFSAPITRRQLIGYKVCRLLFGAAASGPFLAVVAGPPHLVPALFFTAKAAIVMAVLTLHSAGVAMYRSNAQDHGHLTARRWPVLAAAGLLTPVVGAGLAFIAFSSPMRLLAALPVAVLLIGANALWIIRSDSAFEEAATEAADKMNRAIATGHFSTPRISRKRSSPFPLAPRGPAEAAILWKNWLLIGRTSRRTLVVSAILLGSLVTVFAIASDGVLAGDVVGDVSMFVVALTVLLGPAMLRIDLRQDLGHLALIKTWPVRGAALIRGEVFAPAIALSLGAAVAIVIGSAFAPNLLFVDHAGAAARAAFAISALLAGTAVIVAQLVVHNGIAVSFPAWVELKTGAGAAGIEMNARMMIVMYGALLILAFVLVIPAAAAAAAYFVVGGLLIPSAIFAVLLFCESFAATEVIGRILDRTDLQDVVVTE